MGPFAFCELRTTLGRSDRQRLDTCCRTNSGRCPTDFNSLLNRLKISRSRSKKFDICQCCWVKIEINSLIQCPRKGSSAWIILSCVSILWTVVKTSVSERVGCTWSSGHMPANVYYIKRGCLVPKIQHMSINTFKILPCYIETMKTFCFPDIRSWIQKSSTSFGDTSAGMKQKFWAKETYFRLQCENPKGIIKHPLTDQRGNRTLLAMNSSP